MHFILGVETGDWLAPFFVGILLHGCQVLLVEVVLILFSIVGLDGLRLDDDSCIASGERSAFCGDGSGYITRGQS